MGVMSTDSLSPPHPIKSDLPSPYFRSLGSQQPLSRHLNHPPKLRYFHGSMTGTEETLEGKQGGGGIVEKAFALPLVNSTYDSLASLSTPLQPYAEKGASMMSSMGESYGAIKAGVQDKVPDAVSAKVTDAKGQVSAAVNSVDSSLCSGLDKLVDKMTALKKKTPELYNETKSSVGSFAFMATTYVASFTVVSYALKFSEFGMDGADRIFEDDSWREEGTTGVWFALGARRDCCCEAGRCEEEWIGKGACPGECFVAGGVGRSAQLFLPAQPLRGPYSCR